MVRAYHVNGETMVAVKGRSDSSIPVLTNLGLTDVTGKVNISLEPKYSDIQVDAWGNQAVPETQFMLAEARITATFVHFDRTILETCIALAMGGGQGAVGQLARAGTLMGGNVDRFVPGNNYIGLNIASPIEGKTWCFFYTYLEDIRWPLGTEKSLVQTVWRCVPYTIDPWNNGLGSSNYSLWSNTFVDS